MIVAVFGVDGVEKVQASPAGIAQQDAAVLDQQS